MWAHILFAADNPLDRPEIIYGFAGLVVALLAGAFAISLADKWRKRTAAPVRGDEDLLTTYRDMYEHGEITEAEYAELRRKAADKVKNAPAPAPAAAAAAPAPDPTGRPDPAKLAVPAPPARVIPRDPPVPPAAPPDPPPPPGTS